MKKNLKDNFIDFVDRTGSLLIHLLDRCNLLCKHCYLNAYENGKHVLPLDLVKRTIDEANELGIKSVQLSGGEPFLYPHICEVLKSTIGKNFIVTISTNGTLIDDESAALLAETHAHIVTSIDGPEDYHDMFRGRKGSFAKAEDGIARLVDLDIPVKIVTTVCKDSLKYISWCADWAYKIKAKTIQFQPLENIGRGKGIENKRLLEESLHDLFIHVNDLAVFYAPKGLQIKMTYKSRDLMIAHPCTAFVCNGEGCHRGVEEELKKIVIREDGSILPELVDIDKHFSIGNLFNDTLKNNLLIYLNEGYPRFDRLCREVYSDTVLNNPSPLIPWNEILTERSRTFR
ncbi:MAG: radical SAM protein [Maribacter sp.]|nr:radical SAM protein [Maribacter sp.]